MLEVVGVQEVKGTYEGNDYHNVMLHCINENPQDTSKKKHIGSVVDSIKIKFALVKEVFSKSMSSADWQNLIGKEIKVTYNRFGNVDEVRVIENA